MPISVHADVDRAVQFTTPLLVGPLAAASDRHNGIILWMILPRHGVATIPWKYHMTAEHGVGRDGEPVRSRGMRQISELVLMFRTEASGMGTTARHASQSWDILLFYAGKMSVEEQAMTCPYCQEDAT